MKRLLTAIGLTAVFTLAAGCNGHSACAAVRPSRSITHSHVTHHVVVHHHVHVVHHHHVTIFHHSSC